MKIPESSLQKDMDILTLMDLKIDRYFDGSLYISDLIYDLESFLNQLTIVNDQWKKDFRTIWLDIEVAYALALDQGLDNLTDEGIIVTENSLHILRKMIKNKLTYLKNS